MLMVLRVRNLRKPQIRAPPRSSLACGPQGGEIVAHGMENRAWQAISTPFCHVGPAMTWRTCSAGSSGSFCEEGKLWKPDDNRCSSMALLPGAGWSRGARSREAPVVDACGPPMCATLAAAPQTHVTPCKVSVRKGGATLPLEVCTPRIAVSQMLTAKPRSIWSSWSLSQPHGPDWSRIACSKHGPSFGADDSRPHGTAIGANGS